MSLLRKSKTLLSKLFLASALALLPTSNLRAEGTLWIYNQVGSYSNRLIVRHRDSLGLTDSYNSGYDSTYLAPLAQRPGSYSVLPDATLVSTDQRDSNTTNSIKQKLVFNGFNPSDVTNRLYFTFPNSTNIFDGKCITLQECDTNDSPFGPSYNIRDTIANSNGFLNIGTLSNGTYNVNVPYKQFLLWITNAPPETHSVNIENGENFGLAPTNFTGVSAGGSITSSASTAYYTNSPGSRTKINGLKEK